jgi:Zn finger protein HypA/HybF involved in hydrogenase expression
VIADVLEEMEAAVTDYTCGWCDHEFEAPSWEAGTCPECGNKYYSTENCTEDYSDCWEEVEWEKWRSYDERK